MIVRDRYPVRSADLSGVWKISLAYPSRRGHERNFFKLGDINGCKKIFHSCVNYVVSVDNSVIIIPLVKIIANVVLVENLHPPLLGEATLAREGTGGEIGDAPAIRSEQKKGPCLRIPFFVPARAISSNAGSAPFSARLSVQLRPALLPVQP